MKLELDQLSVELQARQIVQDVGLVAHPGEMVGLIGPNGSGKSTLLRAVYRLLRPVAGRVLLGESEDVWRLPAREVAQQIGVVAQETNSGFDFTVQEVVAMGRTPHKGAFSRDTAQDRAVVQQALAQVGLEQFGPRELGSLSGGEKQRVMVARALAQQPQVLVLDEPTNHLDIHHQLELMELLRTLGLTTLITLHDLQLAGAYCDRLYLLNAGRLVTHGRPEDVLTPDRIREVYRVDASVQVNPVTARLHLAFFPLSSPEVV